MKKLIFLVPVLPVIVAGGIFLTSRQPVEQPSLQSVTTPQEPVVVESVEEPVVVPVVEEPVVEEPIVEEPAPEPTGLTPEQEAERRALLTRIGAPEDVIDCMLAAYVEKHGEPTGVYSGWADMVRAYKRRYADNIEPCEYFRKLNRN